MREFIYVCVVNFTIVYEVYKKSNLWNLKYRIDKCSNVFIQNIEITHE